ncbi:MAG: universal stress protein [Micropruina sp.]|uniref:universal stress protein n=1 Tax=Micropruina sp. TaxID=2737536 RepID=UPI0039E38B7B
MTTLTRDKIATADAANDAEDSRKPLLSTQTILLMNLGGFGTSFAFGLQQTAINPLFAMLGADGHSLPILNLAGPMTGLIIQPMIGVMSDHTWHPKWGQRRPYIVAGCVLAALCLFLFPFVSAIWMAVVLLWAMDAGNNTAAEPYKAMIAGKLRLSQRTQGFLLQAMLGAAGGIVANIALFGFQQLIQGSSAAGIPNWVPAVFWTGAACALITVMISTVYTKEIPPTDEELARMRAKSVGPVGIVKEIAEAVKVMPMGMHKLGLVYAFQWYGLFIWWQFASLAIGKTVFNAEPGGPGYEEAVGWTGLANAWGSVVQLLVSLALIPIAVRFGAKRVHAVCLLVAGVGFTVFPHVSDKYLMFLPLAGYGVAMASIASLPYVMATSMVPKERIGVYLGILNMMIVVPQLVQTLTFGWIYEHLLGNDPGNAMTFCGVLFVFGAIAATWVNAPHADDESPIMPLGSPRRITSVYKRVIVGSDGTPASLATVGHAAGLAAAAEARLVVVSAYNPDVSAGLTKPGANEHIDLYGEDAARAAVEASVRELTKHRFKRIETHMIPGSPAQAVLEAAGKDPDNLIVVGNRGVGAAEGEALGAVPREIVKQAVCNVMIVQTNDDGSVIAGGGIRQAD